MLNFYLVIVSALVANQATALSTGAPLISCSSMTPFHVPAMYFKANAPFVLEVSSETGSAGTPITVTLKPSSGSNTFRGYLVQARSGSSTNPIGTFANDNGKVLDCPGGTANAVTHSSNADKAEAIFKWTPPNGFTGKVTIRATVVAVYTKVYKNILSKEITVS